MKDAASRKEFAYKVIRDKRIGALLTKNDYAGAKRLAERMLKRRRPRAPGVPAESVEPRVSCLRRKGQWLGEPGRSRPCGTLHS